MPQVTIQGFGRVSFPDEMSPEEIEQAIERDILPQGQRRTQPQPESTPEKPTPWERFGRGAQNTADRVAQLVVAGGEKLGVYPEGLGDIMTGQINDERERYDKARGGGFDPIELAGSVGTKAPLVALPGGAPTAVSRAAAGAVQGATYGALEYDKSNSVGGTAKNSAVGAGVGALAGPVVGFLGDKATSLYRTLAGRLKGAASNPAASIAKDIPELQRFSPEVQKQVADDYATQIAKAGSFDKESLLRKANLLANNLTPTKSMVTRDAKDWTIERNLQKMQQSPDEELSRIGGEFTDVYKRNDAALSAKLSEFGEGLPKATQEGLGQNVLQSVDDLAKRSQAEVSKVYEQIRASKGPDVASDARNLKAMLDDLQDNAYSEKIVASVRNKLRRFGMLDENGGLTSNSLTVNQAEELRKFVNKLPNDFGKKDIIRAIDEDVLSGAGSDAFAPARQAAAERFANLDNPAAQRALNAAGELSQGKTSQNFIKSQIIDAAEQDVTALLKTLGADRQAKDSIQSGTLQYLESKAINPNSRQFSGAAFNKALDAIGDGKLAKIFGDERARELRSLARAAVDATYQPAYAAVNNSNTAPLLLSATQRARAIPGLPVIVNENAEKLVARSGYRKQLAEAIKATGEAEKPQAPQGILELARALQRASAPAASSSAGQRRR